MSALNLNDGRTAAEALDQLEARLDYLVRIVEKAVVPDKMNDADCVELTLIAGADGLLLADVDRVRELVAEMKTRLAELQWTAPDGECDYCNGAQGLRKHDAECPLLRLIR